MKVCPYDIFWIAEPVVWYGTHHKEPDCFSLLSSRSRLSSDCFAVFKVKAVFRKDWFVVFKVKATVMDHIIKIWLSNVSSELLILLQVNLVGWHITISWIVLWKDWIALLWSRSRLQERFKIPVDVHLDNVSSTAEPCVTKLYFPIGISPMGNLGCFPQKSARQ